MIWKPRRKIFDIFFSSVIKNRKQEITALKFTESRLKAVSFYIIHNLLYESTVTNVTKLLKADVKIRSFLWVIVNSRTIY